MLHVHTPNILIPIFSWQIASHTEGAVFRRSSMFGRYPQVRTTIGMDHSYFSGQGLTKLGHCLGEHERMAPGGREGVDKAWRRQSNVIHKLEAASGVANERAATADTTTVATTRGGSNTEMTEECPKEGVL